MSAFIQLLIIGMGIGGFYALNGLGMVVVFRSSGVINFASGGAAMAGGYVAWHLSDQLGWTHLVAVAVGVVAGAAVNLLVYVLTMVVLRHASTLTKVIATIAILVSLQQGVLLVFGGMQELPQPFLSQAVVHFGSVTVGWNTLIFLAFTTALTAVLWATYRFTRFGLATSALSEAPRSLSGLGWRTGRLRAANWAIAGALAGVTGVAVGQFLQLSITNFAVILVPTLAAAILGGLRSFPATLGGGLFIGGAQALAQRYINIGGIQDAIPFLTILVVMQMFGRTLPLRSFVQERLPRVGSGEVRIGRLLIGVAVVIALGFVVQESWVVGASTTVFLAGIVLSQVVITGYTGQLSLAQLSVSGVGALVACNAATHLGLGFLVSLLVGMVAVVPVGVLLGIPALRARGVSLGIATFGFSVAVGSVVLSAPSLTGGLAGFILPPPSVFGWNIDFLLYPRRYFMVSVVVFTLLALLVANVRRGRTGRRMLAVRNNERAAAAMGIGVTATKLYAFTVAAAIAGVTGTLAAFAQTTPQFTQYGPVASLYDLLTAVLGGVGYVIGAVFGGTFAQTGLPNAIISPITDHLSWWNSFFPLLIGVLLVIQLWINPNGIADDLAHGSRLAVARLMRRRRAAATAAATEEQATLAVTPGGGTDSRDTKLSRVQRASQFTTQRQLARRRHLAVLSQLDKAAQQKRILRGAALDVSGVCVTFGSVVAVDDANFTVRPGEVLGVIGPNGAGKTTLMDAITGFVSSSGSVMLDGVEIQRWSVRRRARAGLTRSFQSLELLEDMTVLDNLRCAAEPQDASSMIVDLIRPGRWTPTPAMAASIAAFGLRDKLDKVPAEISYGDRRLVAVARAVAAEPAVLLLDEPAAGLSAKERGELTRLIRLMADEWGIAILLIEHDVELIRNVADRVVALDFGRQIAEGTPEEVLQDRAVVDAYLGPTGEQLANLER